jgi:hypothetical protein
VGDPDEVSAQFAARGVAVETAAAEED